MRNPSNPFRKKSLGEANRTAPKPSEIRALVDLLDLDSHQLFDLCEVCVNNRDIGSDVMCAVPWDQLDEDQFKEIEREHGIMCMYWTPK